MTVVDSVISKNFEPRRAVKTQSNMELFFGTSNIDFSVDHISYTKQEVREELGCVIVCQDEDSQGRDSVNDFEENQVVGGDWTREGPQVGVLFLGMIINS